MYMYVYIRIYTMISHTQHHRGAPSPYARIYAHNLIHMYTRMQHYGGATVAIILDRMTNAADGLPDSGYTRARTHTHKHTHTHTTHIHTCTLNPQNQTSKSCADHSKHI